MRRLAETITDDAPIEILELPDIVEGKLTSRDVTTVGRLTRLTPDELHHAVVFRLSRPEIATVQDALQQVGIKLASASLPRKA